MKRYDDRKWPIITIISGINNFYYYKINNQEFYFFTTDTTMPKCSILPIQCDNNLKIYGDKCTNFNTLLNNWFLFNDNFGVRTIYNHDTYIKLPVDTQKFNIIQTLYVNDKNPFYMDDIKNYINNINFDNLNLSDILDIIDDIDVLFQFIINNYKELIELVLYPENTADILKKIPKYINNNLFSLYIKNFTEGITNIKYDSSYKYLLEQYVSNTINKTYNHIKINTNFNNILNNLLEEAFNPNIKQIIEKYFINYINYMTSLFTPIYYFIKSIHGLINVMNKSKTTLITYTEPYQIDYYNTFFIDYLNVEKSFIKSNTINCISDVALPINSNGFRRFVSQQQKDKYTTFAHFNTFNIKNIEKINIQTVKNLNLNLVKPQRAGVLMYTIIDGELFFGFGIDAKFNEYTDFGGGIQYKKDINVIIGALREFHEETLAILPTISFNNVLDNVVLYNNQMLILFLYIDDLADISQKFNKALLNSKFKKKEVSSIKWISETSLKQMLNTLDSKIYERVRQFLLNSGDFYKFLH